MSGDVTWEGYVRLTRSLFAPVEVSDSGQMRFRPSRGQQAVFLIMLLPMAFAVFVFIRIRVAVLLVTPSVLAFEYFYLSFVVGVTLAHDHVLVRNIRRRKIMWAQVRYIRIEPWMGNRTIVIYEEGGRRTRLRAPISGFLYGDRRFEEKYRTIGQWYLDHRGEQRADDSWTGPPVGPRWAERSRIRPAAAQAGPILLVLASLACEALLGFEAAPSGGADVVGHIVGALLLAVLAAAMWQFGVRAGVTMAADDLVVHGLRRRRIRWRDISSISVERRWSGTRLVVEGIDGRRTRLPGPRVGFLLGDRAFGEKAWAVHHRWLACLDRNGDRGLDLAGVRQPQWWKTALVSLACVVLSFELFIGVIVTLLFAATSGTT